MASRSTPHSFASVPGCPASVRIYQIPASSKWQFRWFTDGKAIRRSLQTTDKREALRKAKELYADLFLECTRGGSIQSNSLSSVIERFVSWQSTQVNIGKISPRWHREDLYKIAKDLRPQLGHLNVQSINRSVVEEYIHGLSQRQLTRSTLNKHIALLKKVLRYAAESGLINQLPWFPRLGVDNNARPYFTRAEYKTLRLSALRSARSGLTLEYKLKEKKVRNLHYTLDFYDFIIFAMNAFVRVSDLKDLKHRNIVVEDDAERYVEIFPPKSKTSDSSSLSMPNAVRVYRRIAARHKALGYGSRDDYVFYPEYRNREYMLQNLQRLFTAHLDHIDLRKDPKGRNRTLYSLRHSVLMYRFLYGDGIDLFVLAKNALTSVEMLEKFYLSHAESKDRIREIQSIKKRSPPMKGLIAK